MMQPSILQMSECMGGWLLRIDGRGSLNESPALRAAVHAALEADAEAVAVLDLEACSYLDSTMLGCLVGLHREFSLKMERPRFLVSAEADARQRLLGPTRLDRLLVFCERRPEVTSEWTPLRSEQPGTREFGRHVMECHSRLAELDGPKAAAWRQVAEQLAGELGEAPAGEGSSPWR